MDMLIFFGEEIMPHVLHWCRIGLFLGGDIFLGYVMYNLLKEELKGVDNNVRKS